MARTKCPTKATLKKGFILAQSLRRAMVQPGRGYSGRNLRLVSAVQEKRGVRKRGQVEVSSTFQNSIII